MDLLVDAEPGDARAQVVPLAEAAELDAIVQPADAPRKRLLIADMDSTLIGQECIDELADVEGLRDEVAALTERAMAGEIAFEDALSERVALLKGVRAAAIEALLAERINLSEGAAELIEAARAGGLKTVLVSGGFMQFAGPVATRLAIDAAYANTLEVADGHLTGRLVPPLLGPDAKRERLAAECAALGITAREVVAIGDGANDLPMLREAGLAIGHRPKPVVAEAVHGIVRHTDLRAVAIALDLIDP